ncbi:reductase [Lithospermum erythrorhizon]|uniref:2,4-dienoyl-CoA reductase [(3E)-enoyl-CoA-producing] n=1 Tax=Lithospermum erythrorhizon TaxID=34254 RepID=A0AAV3QFM9_LITER
MGAGGGDSWGEEEMVIGRVVAGEDILKGKVALLTGGGSGIGFEISTQFSKHGASIAIMGRRWNAVGFEGDVRKQEDARRVVESTIKHFGKWDIAMEALYLASEADSVKQVSREVERKARAALVGVPKSKL